MNAPIAQGFRPVDPAQPRHDWTLAEVEALFELPFTELVFRAAETHRAWFDPTEVQLVSSVSTFGNSCRLICAI